MYLYFGFVEETASTITFATELAGNPCGTLYKYFLYASENLEDFFIKESVFGLDTVMILVSIKPGLILITRMFVFHSSILRASNIASNANFVAEYAPINGSYINHEKTQKVNLHVAYMLAHFDLCLLVIH
jgi:hypothetical protein